MSLLHFNKVSIAYGDHPLLSQVEFRVNPKERVCLIGRNGEGKSTLLKSISGKVTPDDGNISFKESLRIGILNQDLPVADDQTVYNMIASGLSEAGELLTQWHHLSHHISDDADMKKLENIQQRLESMDGWSLQSRIEKMLERFNLNGDDNMGSLSGGGRRRVELAGALVNNPELLLLDEPTNHMDIITINWLEKELKNFAGAIIFITHDRAFLRSLATRIIELDRGNLTSFNCNYDTYLSRKAHQLTVEQTHNAVFDKRLAQEESWIRQGIKARRTRNEGRVRALEAMRQERKARRTLQGKAQFSVEGAERSGKLVAELMNVSHHFGEKTLIKDFNFCLMRGDKVGLVGANGVGKSTLLKIMLDDLAPCGGKVRYGTKLKVAYFDQMREQLDLEKTVIDNVSEGRERISINGKDRHIISYLEDFLFSPKRARTPVKALSGGERNRLLLARLFSKPSNLLVMDEPTNDLDVETLELLESILVDYAGTLLLVSHDRDFLDNVVSSTLVFEGEGSIKEYVGGFCDWLSQGGSLDTLAQTGLFKVGNKKTEKNQVLSKTTSDTNPKKPSAQKKKLSYKLQKELEALPAEIEALEKQIQALEQKTASGDFYSQAQEVIQQTLSGIEQLNKQLEEKIERWAELEEQ